MLTIALLTGGNLFTQEITITEGVRANIIPNPGFEDYSGVPLGWFYKGKHFTDLVSYWSSATGASPDAFGPGVRVPSHWANKGFGNHGSHRGKGMAGITVYGCEGGKPHCREYLQIQLLEPLVKNQKYYLEFFVAPLPKGLRTNQIGAALSDKRIDERTDAILTLEPIIKSERVRKEQAWTRIYGTFTADQSSNYLLIGNFFPDSLTTAEEALGSEFNFAYYYIDDVRLTKQEPILNVPSSKSKLKAGDLTKGSVIRLNNIYFDVDKSILLPRSYSELNDLVNIMNSRPSMKIEVRGHTDITGNKDYNFILSLKRARAVVEYLIEQDISPSRLRYRGFGNTLPMADNDTAQGRSLNRRVEVRIIED